MTNRDFETPVQEIDEKNPAGTILKRDKDLVITPLTHAEYEKELKKPTQAFVCNIVFPKTLEEVLEFSNLEPAEEAPGPSVVISPDKRIFPRASI